jgi:uncharacterized protein YndB with AHSA1/START domain
MASPSSAAKYSLQVRRTFPVPREKMFAMWSQPQHLEQWVGRVDPRNVVKYRKFDFREGGGHLFENRTADGIVFLNRGEYLEIKPLEKIKFTWALEQFDSAGKKIGEVNGTVVTVEFFDQGNSTEVVLTHEQFTHPEMRDRHNAGWNLCFDRLGEHITDMQKNLNAGTQGLDPKTSLEIRRVFKAPRQKVYDAWTQLEHLQHWMCRDVPTHDVKYVELDVRPGGRYTIQVKTAEGVTYIGRGIFREVKPPEKLVFTWGWTRSPEDPKEPLQKSETTVTVELVDRGASTEMVFTHTNFVHAKELEDTRKGWGGCFDVLEQYLEGRK